MLLAFDTSSAACTAALFDGAGACLAQRDELIGRGHAERLVPMIAELLDGRPADRILVGVGPGSFTGIRVAIAAAHGLAIGWGAELAGMSSLALARGGRGRRRRSRGRGRRRPRRAVRPAIRRRDVEPTSELRNLAPGRSGAR